MDIDPKDLCQCCKTKVAKRRREEFIAKCKRSIEEANARIKANREEAERIRNRPIFGIFSQPDLYLN